MLYAFVGAISPHYFNLFLNNHVQQQNLWQKNYITHDSAKAFTDLKI